MDDGVSKLNEAEAAAAYDVVAALLEGGQCRISDIAVVTPFRYSRLVFALILAVVIFDEVPDGWSLIGSAIIIGSGLFTLWREQRALSKQRALAA